MRVKLYIMQEEKFLPRAVFSIIKKETKQNFTNIFYACISTAFLSDAKMSSIIAEDRSPVHENLGRGI